MLPKTPTLQLVAVLALLAATQCGCAQWSSRPTTGADAEAQGLPALQQRPDSVEVDTVLVRFSTQQVDQLNEMWLSVDETILDISTRRRIENNGLRCGVFSGPLPSLVVEKLNNVAPAAPTDAREAAELGANSTGLASSVDTQARRLRCRAGRRKEILVGKLRQDPLHILTRTDDGRIAGNTFLRASTLFDLRAIPYGDGSATLRLTPELQHGDARKTFLSTEVGVRTDIRQQQQIWKDLLIEARLTPGQVLVVAPTHPPQSVGGAFFENTAIDRSPETVLLLLRLGETRLDELFAPELVEQARVLAEQ